MAVDRFDVNIDDKVVALKRGAVFWPTCNLL